MKLKCPHLLKPLGTIIQQNYWFFYPSEPFSFVHYIHPVVKIIFKLLAWPTWFVFLCCCVCYKSLRVRILKIHEQQIMYWFCGLNTSAFLTESLGNKQIIPFTIFAHHIRMMYQPTKLLFPLSWTSSTVSKLIA